MSAHPERRFTMNEIMSHKWLMYKRNFDAVILQASLQLDSDILEEMTQQGFDPEFVELCVNKNRRNNVTTTYHMLCKKG